jgi:hypothetical protein
LLRLIEEDDLWVGDRNFCTPKLVSRYCPRMSGSNYLDQIQAVAPLFSERSTTEPGSTRIGSRRSTFNSKAVMPHDHMNPPS